LAEHRRHGTLLYLFCGLTVLVLEAEVDPTGVAAMEVI
jgi:hypothetical protein